MRFLRSLLVILAVLAVSLGGSAAQAKPLAFTGAAPKGDHKGDDDSGKKDEDGHEKGDEGGKPGSKAPAPAPAPAPAATPTPSGGSPDATPAPAAPGAPAATEQAAPTPSFASTPTIDPRLAAVADAALAQDPNATLHVLVLARDASSAVTDSGGATGADSGSLAGATIAVARLDELAAAHGVAYLMLDLPVLPTGATDTSTAATPMPYAKLVGAPAAWRRGLSGKGVGIAVIDSGVTRTADFPNRRLVQVRLPGEETLLDDSYGHGTFVAGIAAGSNGDYRGVAPGASVYGINVSRSDGVYTSDVIAALQWVLLNRARLGIRVVNLSLAETAPSSYLANPLDTIVEQLWRAGVVVVAAAGNNGPGSAMFAPANDPFAITVGALDEDGHPASFSTSGTTPDGFAKPELLAPGRHIVSALPDGTTLHSRAPAANVVAPGYAMMSGTSMSAPQVAAAAAILLQEHPRWTPDQVKWVLVRTSWPAVESIAGSLDLARAVAFAARPRSANRTATQTTFGLRPSTASLRRIRNEEMPEGSPTFDASSWNASSWNASSWNASSWNASSWNASSWNASSWNASSWN